MQTKKKAGSFAKALKQIEILEKENQTLKVELRKKRKIINLQQQQIESRTQVSQVILDSKDRLAGLKEAFERMPQIIKKTMGGRNAKSK